MKVEVTFHVVQEKGDHPEVLKLLKSLHIKVNKLATKEEFEAVAAEATAALGKISTDIDGLKDAVTTLNAKVDELQALLDAEPDGTIPQEAMDKMTEVRDAAKAVDDKVPDAPAPPDMPT